MKKLHDLEPAEVSLVSRGANKRKFLVFKSQKGNSVNTEILELLKNVDPKVMAKVEKVIKDMSTPQIPGAANPNAQSTMPSDRAQAALKAAARILTPFQKELGGELLQKVMQAAGMQMPDGKPGTIEGNNMGLENKDTNKSATQSPEKVTDEHSALAMKDAECAYKAALAKLGYQKYSEGKLQMKSLEGADAADDDEEDDVEKSGVAKAEKPKGESKVTEQVLKADGSLNLEAIPEAVRPAVEHIFKAQQELVKKNADLTKELEDRKTAEQKREVVAKADSYSHLGIPKEEIVATLEDAKKLGTEAYIRITKQFETLNEQNRTGGLFKEIGSPLSGGTNGAGSWEAIEKASQAHVQKSGEKMSKEQAIDAYLNTAEGNRQYAEHQASRKGGI